MKTAFNLFLALSFLFNSVFTVLPTVAPVRPAQAQTAPAPLTPVRQAASGPAAPAPAPVRPELRLFSTTTCLTPDQDAALSWEFTPGSEWGGREQELELLLSFPPGFTPGAAWAERFDSRAATLRLPLSSDQSLQGRFTSIPGDALTVRAAVLANGKTITQSQLSLPKGTLRSVSAAGGEAALGEDQLLKVIFPPGALDEDIQVCLTAPGSVQLPQAGRPTSSGHAFSLTATGQKTGAAIHKFSKPVQIVVRYAGLSIEGSEGDQVLSYYDAQNGYWRPLVTEVDRKSQTLTAVSDHFSEYDFNAQSWQSARMPSVAGFQTSQFTGAGTYSYPLALPAGPAGLQPALSLNYNSQTIDRANAFTQAGIAGMGWSIETGYIERSMHGTETNQEDLVDDTFSLVVNGVSNALLPISGDPDNNADTVDYRTVDDTFWQIRRYLSRDGWGNYSRETSYWQAWDKNGSLYQFGQRGESNCSNGHYECDGDRAEYPTLGWGDSLSYETWRWSLTRAQNPAGQTVEYYYQIHHTPRLLKVGYPAMAAMVTLPTRIVYPNGKYQVVFQYSWRADFHPSWMGEGARTNYSDQKIDTIEVQNYANSAWTSFRKYALDYDQTDAQQVFPGVTWPEYVENGTVIKPSAPTLTLSSITEFGSGTSSLPATTFTYDDLHLTGVDNGYGGTVGITYDAWHDVSGPGWSERSKSQAATFTGGYRLEWFDTKFLYEQTFHPGGYYRLEADVSTPTQSICASDGDGFVSQVCQTFTGQSGTLDVVLHLDSEATKFRPALDCPANYTCSVSRVKITPLTPYSRVTQQSLGDGRGSSPILTGYAYHGAATNDKAHSTLIANQVTCWDDSDPGNDLCYSAQYSEFRGHAAVTESGPDGRSSTTWFYQDDLRAGQPSSTQTLGPDPARGQFAEPFNSLNTSNWSVTHSSPYLSIAPYLGDPALKTDTNGLPTNTTVWASRPLGSVSAGTGQAVTLQFKVDAGTSTEAFYFFETSSSSYRRWGIKLLTDGSLVAHSKQDDSGTATEVTLIPATGSNAFVRGDWYQLWLVVSDTRLFVRTRLRDNPAALTGRYEIATPDSMKNRTWRFSQATRNGAAWLDEYREGRLYGITETRTDTVSDLVATLYPLKYGSQSYQMSPIHWNYPVWNKSFSFEGGAEWLAKYVENFYDTALQGGTQHGNLTKQFESIYNNGFSRYRATYTNYYPSSDSAKNLVGLPARVSNYACTDSTCAETEANLLGQVLYLYDGHTAYDTAPTTGLLTRQRTRLTISSAQYNDELYVYDAWGNRVKTTRYTGTGDASNFASSVAQTSVTCFGATVPGDSSCSADNYATFPLWQKNALWTTAAGQMSYDLARGGLPTGQTDANQATTSATYDDFGRVLSVTRPGSTTADLTVTYHDTNPYWTEATQRVDTNLETKVRKFYNGLGELIQTQQVNVTLADNACSTDSDSTPDTCTVVTDQRVDYTGGVKHTRQSTPYAVATPSGYYLPTGHETPVWTTFTETTYDVLGRPVKVQAPWQLTDDTSQRYAYSIDLDGYRAKTNSTDPLGRVTQTWADSWGRTERVRPPEVGTNGPPAGPVIKYNYDPANRLVSVEQLKSSDGTTFATTSLSYDLGGRKLSMSDPDMGSWSYAYNALGGLTQQVDAKNQRTCLYYDQLNRLTGKSYQTGTTCPSAPGTNEPAYSYDSTSGGNYGMGRRTGMSDASGSAAWVYDLRGRATQETKVVTGSGTFIHQMGYNNADLLSTLRYPGGNQGQTNGEQVSYTYLPQQALSSVSGTNTYLQSAAYDAAGRLVSRQLNGAWRTNYGYYDWDDANQGGRLETLSSSNDSIEIYSQNFGYEYDAAGNLSTISDKVLGTPTVPQVQTFTYDNLNRLVSAVAASGQQGNYTQETYAYDPSGGTGNLTSKGTQTLGYAAQSSTCPDGALVKKHAATSKGSDSYCYDANGNQSRRTIGGVVYALTYDAENRLTGVSWGSNSAIFTYDADGARVKSLITINSVPTTITYIGSDYEWSGSVDTAVRYYYAGTARIAMRKGDSDLYVLFGDHLGSTSATWRNSGGLSVQGYKPWGEVRTSANNNLPTDETFTGQQTVESIGLMYFQARWYDSSLGRFAQADTIVPQPGSALSWDRYAYCNNSPVMYTDPSGHFTEEEISDYLKKLYVNTWRAYLDAWKSDQLFWEMLSKAADGDELQARFANLKGTFHFDKENGMSFEGEGDLRDFQGKGAYRLRSTTGWGDQFRELPENDKFYSDSTIRGSCALMQSCTPRAYQPIYDYSGTYPVYSGIMRMTYSNSSTNVGQILDGSGIPFVVAFTVRGVQEVLIMSGESVSAGNLSLLFFVTSGLNYLDAGVFARRPIFSVTQINTAEGWLGPQPSVPGYLRNY